MRHKIFLDLDGVFADLDKKIRAECGEALANQHSNDIWPILAKQYRCFWYLDLMPDSLKIVTMLHHHDLEVLTALPESRPGEHGLATADDDKRAWVAHHISRRMKVNTVVGGANKIRWAQMHPGSYLIDDYERNINLWNQHGGIGILHKDVPSTLEKLHDLNLT